MHSFDIGVHISSRPSILLICTHRVHCMTFEQFDDLRVWADTLQASILCEYFYRIFCFFSVHFEQLLQCASPLGTRFFASLYSAPKSSRLHSYVDPNLPTSPTPSETDPSRTSNSAYAYLSHLFYRSTNIHRTPSSGDGFLHATTDRLLFVTTNPQSQRQPASLIASWNFNHGDIRVYGTGRISSQKLFYLVAAGSGRHVFACDRATELCAWIQRATKPASYLYERRWMSSVAAQLGEDQTMLVTMTPSDGSTTPQRRRVHGISWSESSEVR